ncbi:MAG: glycosyltransferase family 39 protein [Candidatus ainarchaeum sp.]|nr:glycosyltransferase family 39 protein [Candidatus ainarchaeum sp.]
MNILEDRRIIIGCAAVFALMFFLFYPNFYHYPDEQTYLRNAYLIFTGKMLITDPLYSYGYAFNGSAYVSAYPPLHSVLIAPFALFGWQFSFLLGLVLHLINLFIIYKILKKLDLPAIFSLLYLFFPAIALLSTTLEAEMSSITFVLLTAYFFLRNDNKGFALAGFFAGISVLSRYTNAAIALAFLIAIFIDKKKVSKAWLFIAGAVPGAAITLAFNSFLYGSPFATAYSVLGYASFTLQDFPLKAAYYVALLSVIFPLMFFAMFFSKNRLRNATIISSIIFVLLWGSYFFFYPRFRLEDLIIGADKFAPIVPLMLVCYAECLWRIIQKFSIEKYMGKIAVVAIILMVACSGFAMLKHKEKQDLKFEVFKKIYSETPEGALIIVDEKISSLSGKYKETPFTGMFFTEFFGNRKLASIKEDYTKYIVDEKNTFFMAITMNPNITVEITPFEKK